MLLYLSRLLSTHAAARLGGALTTLVCLVAIIGTVAEAVGR